MFHVVWGQQVSADFSIACHGAKDLLTIDCESNACISDIAFLRGYLGGNVYAEWEGC